MPPSPTNVSEYLPLTSIQLCAGRDVRYLTYSPCPQHFGINIFGDERGLNSDVAKFFFSFSFFGKADICQD